MKLRPKQQEIVDSLDGYVRVIAGAGSGKTRVLTERFANIVRRGKATSDEIMCCTFTNDAAKEMKSRISKALGSEQGCAYLRTFHSFCCRFLREEVGILGISNRFKVLDISDCGKLASTAIDYLDLKKSLGMTGKKVYNDIISKVKDENDFTYIDLLVNHSIKELWGIALSNTYLGDMFEGIKIKSVTREGSFYDYHYVTKMQDMSLQMKQALVGYLTFQKENNALDFDDLINLTLYILEKYPGVRERWQNKIKFIQVDEFQDVNIKELKIVALLSEKSGNLFVVGDPDQCIYSFRGANVNCIVDFDDLLSKILNRGIQSKTIYLEENFRSSPEILDIANEVILHNKVRLDKTLIPMNKNGLIAKHMFLKEAEDESDWVAEEIRRLHDKEGYAWKDIAILYRINRLSRNFELPFMGKIPYKLVRDTAFYNRKEIKLILAYLNVLAYHDNIAMEHILGYIKGVGPKKIVDLRELGNSDNLNLYYTLLKYKDNKVYKRLKLDELIDNLEELSRAYKDMSLTDLVHKVFRTFDIEEALKKLDNEEDRMENVREFFQSVEDYERANEGEEISLEKYLEEISLFTSSGTAVNSSAGDDSEESKEDEDDKVQLMTIHAAKGLEFPVVFVVGVVNTLLPYDKAEDEGKIEEERRLFYVAVTRAEERLYLTGSQSTCTNVYVSPSKFLEEIPSWIFESNIEVYTRNQRGLSEIYDYCSPEVRAGIKSLSEKQLTFYLQTHDVLLKLIKRGTSEDLRGSVVANSLRHGCIFDDEIEYKLVQFIHSLTESTFKKWFEGLSIEMFDKYLENGFKLDEELLDEDAVLDLLSKE